MDCGLRILPGLDIRMMATRSWLMASRKMASITGSSWSGGAEMLVYGILSCEEHGEFEVSGDVDPPLLSDQVNIWAECPECGLGALARHQLGSGRMPSCEDCVSDCKQGVICSQFWPSDTIENEILMQEQVVA